MFSLDAFSVFFMTQVTVVLVSLATLLAWRLNSRVPGMRRFAWGLLALSFGSVVGLFRVVFPGPVVLLVFNAFTVGGLVAVAQGMRRFRDLPPLSRALMTGIAVPVAAAFLYWLLIRPSYPFRVALLSPVCALLSLDCAMSSFRGVSRRSRMIHWPIGFVFLFTATFLTIRMALALSGFYNPGAPLATTIETISIICSNIAYIGSAFSIMLASNTRLRLEAEEQANFDPLTSLPNRRLLLDRLQASEHNALMTGQRFGLIYLDLDGFKQLNDSLGHDAGDDILRRASAAMKLTAGLGNCVARIGGDEFVVLVERAADRNQVKDLAARMKLAVEREPVTPNQPERIRISCGVALFPDDGGSAHVVMREADAAMYSAKRRNRPEPIAPVSGLMSF